MPGEHLDLTSGPDDDRTNQPDDVPPAGAGERRPFLGVHFVCCDVYSRIYVNHYCTAFHGHCPRCSRPVVVKIGPGGSDERFFQAG